MNSRNVMPDLTNRRNRIHYLTAINLLEIAGVPARNVNIKAVGEYENYRGEIRSQDPGAGEPVGPDTIVTLEIGISSAVDFMPYQFFYGLRGSVESDGSWEDSARLLMAPFDAARIRCEAAMQAGVIKHGFGIIDRSYMKRFIELFDYEALDDSAGMDEILFLASILPEHHRWGGNPGITAKIIRRLFGYDTRFRENVRSETDIPRELRYRIGSRSERLGKETVLGGRFEEYDSTYEIEFMDVPPDDIKGFLPGGNTRERVEKFLAYCMPGDLDHVIKVKMDCSGPESDSTGYLGYSTFLRHAG